MKKLVKCIICGAVFEEGAESCPVCGVGSEHFVPYEDEESSTESEKIKIVILGTGAAGLSAAKEIRRRNENASITMISDEKYLPYNRPMLTKKMFEVTDENEIKIHSHDWYNENNIEIITDEHIESLDCENQKVKTSEREISYDKCIYALGARCFIPPINGSENAFAIRSIDDVLKIQEKVKKSKNAVVIGGGVLGLEAAWELKKQGLNVTVLETLSRLMAGKFDEESSKFLEKTASDAGIRIVTGVKVESIGEGFVKTTDESIDADIVIMSCGIRANTNIAQNAGISIGRAVIVDKLMRCDKNNVYACGDCAEFEGKNYGIWPEASEMGKIAGANACGANAYYEQRMYPVMMNALGTSVFSIGNVCDEGLKEIKNTDGKTFEKYYFKDDILIGAILIGLMGKTKDVSKMVEDKINYREFEEKGL